MSTHAPKPEPTYPLVQVSEAELDHAVDALRTLHKAHAVAHAVSVGTLVVERFYAGDFAAARSRDPGKHLRYQELIERRGEVLADLSLPDRTLRRCIAATDVWRGLPDEVRSKLAIVHLEKLATLADGEVRKQIAREAATLTLTGEQVGRAVADEKRKTRGHKAKPGRKQKPAVLKAAVAARAQLHKLDGLRKGAGKLSGAEAAEFKTLVAELQRLVGRLVVAEE